MKLEYYLNLKSQILRSPHYVLFQQFQFLFRINSGKKKNAKI